MSLYQKIKAAQDNKDLDGYLDCLHEDFVFVRHQSGTEVIKSDWTPTLTAMMQSDALEFNNQFPDGSSEAVLVVNLLKDGKIIRVETGATPVK
jgi:hypothetical protein